MALIRLCQNRQNLLSPLQLLHHFRHARLVGMQVARGRAVEAGQVLQRGQALVHRGRAEATTVFLL